MEIERRGVGARVDKIAQPGRDELVLSLRSRDGAAKLLLSAGASNARVHFTQAAPENPKTPPMFCMLLRKHLSGAKLAAVRQVGMDRILFLDFDATNDLGDPVRVTLAVEIMGRHSNIIVLDGEERIIDSVRRVDPDMSSVRQVLPGMRYALPPGQDRLSVLQSSPDEILGRLEAGRDIELSKALLETLQGVSPLLSREIAHFAARGREMRFSDLDAERRERLAFFLRGLADTLRNGTGTPTMVMEPSGRPRDFSFVPINQYGAEMLTREYPDYSALLDAFYMKRDEMERIRQRSSDLLKILANTADRIARRTAAQREELLECARREELKEKGDLISANLYAIEKGDESARVQNFYDPGGGMVEIALDTRLTPVQNAQRYYALYRKADTAEKILTARIREGEEEAVYIASVFDALTRAKSEAELAAIRRELVDSGYVRSRTAAERRKKDTAPGPLRYRSTDGFTILSGRNNVQNDRLTLKDSRNYDIWLHTQKIPGSHTIIVADGKDIPKSTIEQACVIAAWNSRARESAKVPVDYTFVRHVRKPSGAKPGMVIYDSFQTVIVDPDEELVGRLTVT